MYDIMQNFITTGDSFLTQLAEKMDPPKREDSELLLMVASLIES